MASSPPEGSPNCQGHERQSKFDLVLSGVPLSGAFQADQLPSVFTGCALLVTPKLRPSLRTILVLMFFLLSLEPETQLRRRGGACLTKDSPVRLRTCETCVQLLSGQAVRATAPSRAVQHAICTVQGLF